MDFEFHTKLNLIVGVSAYLPEDYEKSSKIFKFLWKFYEYFGLLSMTGIVVLMIAAFGMHFNDLEIVCTSGGSALFTFQIIFKKIVFSIHGELFKNIIKNILETSEMLNQNPVNDPDFSSIFQKSYRNIKIITLVKTILEAVGMTSMFIFFIIKGIYFDLREERKMPALYWTPYDFRETPYYVLSLVIENIVGFLAFPRNTAMDSLFCTILITLSLQLRFAKRILESILEKHEKDRENSVSEMKSNENDLSRKLEEDLRWWMIVHQKILRSATDMKRISSPYLAYIFFTMAAEFFLVGTLSTISVLSAFQKYSIVFLHLTNIFQLYIISTLGDALTDDGLEVTDAGFDINILHSTTVIKKNYLFTLMRSKEPILLKAADLSSLSAHTFGRVARMAFSYFVTVLQIRQERNPEI